MTVIATYTQQPADRLDYDIPYELAAGDSLSSVSVSVSPAGLTVTGLIVGSNVKLWVSGGTAGTAYKIEVTASSTLGRTKQVEVKMRIKEY